MKEMVILIVMMFTEYGVYPDSVEIHSRYGEPLRFASEQECANHINDNFGALKEFAMTMYPEAVTVKSMVCVEKENGFTGV